MNLNPEEVNSCWWENNSHRSSLWPLWHHHRGHILPLRDYETYLTDPYILIPISVLYWLPSPAGTCCHDLWNFLVCCLMSVCSSPSLLPLQVVGTFPELMRSLVTLCSGLSLYSFAYCLVVWVWGIVLLTEYWPTGSIGDLEKASKQLHCMESNELCLRQSGSSGAHWFFRALICPFHSPGLLTPAEETT